MQRPCQQEQPSYSGYRILVADDNAINCQIAKRLLEKLGCDVELAVSGRQVLSLQAHRPYDLILMDCQMPEVDGYEAAVRLRETEGEQKRTFIIGWTANAGREEEQKCLAAGMDGCLGKHLCMSTLENMLAQWLRSARLSTGIREHPSDRAGLEDMHRMVGKGFAELVALFEDDMPRRIDAVKQAISHSHYLEVSRIAHMMSGCCASIGAFHLSNLCQELELHAKRGTAEGMDAKLATVQTGYVQVQRILRAMLSS